MPGRRRPPRPITGGPGASQASPAPRSTGHPRDAGYIVRASELGSYAYCERAWWLRYVARVTPADAGQARLEAGHARHAAHGRGVARAALLRRLGLLCAGLAMLLMLLWVVFALLAL